MNLYINKFTHTHIHIKEKYGLPKLGSPFVGLSYLPHDYHTQVLQLVGLQLIWNSICTGETGPKYRRTHWQSKCCILNTIYTTCLIFKFHPSKILYVGFLC